MDGIIFDLDGTLWDSTDAVAYAWNKALEEKTNIEKRVTGPELKKLFGKPLDEILEIVFPDLNKAETVEVEQVLYEYQQAWLERGTCETYEGVIDGIKELSRKYQVFIVSNCQAGYIEVFLKVTGLGDYITDHTCPGDTGLLKGKNIRLIMERNHLNKIIYVGDTSGDKKACDEARVPMILANYGFGEANNPCAVIESFYELLDVEFDALCGAYYE
ncbi:MAG: HAD family hydrolase [Eubacteriales bacterium]